MLWSVATLVIKLCPLPAISEMSQVYIVTANNYYSHLVLFIFVVVVVLV